MYPYGFPAIRIAIQFVQLYNALALVFRDGKILCVR